MHTLILRTVPAIFLAAAGSAAMAQATAFAERSEVLATGQDVRLYGLSTKDANGKIRCFDVTMNLPIAANGRPADTAAVTSAACPKANPLDFIPGSYSSQDGYYACTLQASPFAGRTELTLYCNHANVYFFTYTWYTGPIAGSPIEAQLTAAGLNTLPGNQEYAWGRVISTQNLGGCTFSIGTLFGAREVNGRLDFSFYGDDSTLDCTSNFVKTTP